MADEQNASAVCVHQPTYYPQYIGLRGNIQHGGCFIQNQQPRLKQQTACNGNPLGFSAGEANAAVGKLDSALPVETLVRQALKALANRG